MAGANRKIRLTVRISLPGRPVEDGTLFVRGRAPCHDGSGTLLELMNSQEPFLPFERSSDGLTVLLNRAHIHWVSIPSNPALSFSCPPADRFIREELVQVDIAQGGRVKGLIVLELDNPTRRASDYLNGSESFFHLITAESQYLINKAAVLDMVVFETSPMPQLTA